MTIKQQKPIVIGLFCLLLLITRIISFREFSLDPDELEWLYVIQKCLEDPRPFVGFDAHTTGPFTIYLLTLIKLLTGFSSVTHLRLVSFFFFIIPSLLFIYNSLKKENQLIGSLAFVILICSKNTSDFGEFYDGIYSYNTEYPILFFSSILIWISRTKNTIKSYLVYAFILFLLPFIKFQSIPLTLFFGGFLLIKLWIDQKWKLSLLLLGFYLLLNLIWLGYLYFSDLLSDFQYAYISHNLNYLGSLELEQKAINPLNYIHRINEYYSFVYIFFILGLYHVLKFPVSPKNNTVKSLIKHPITESLLLFLVSSNTIIISKSDYGHYYIYLFLPLSLFVADLLDLLKTKNTTISALFIIILVVNFNFDFLGKSIGLIWNKATRQPVEQYNFGKPFKKLANEELVHWLKLHKDTTQNSLVILGWTQAQALYYVLRGDFSSKIRTSHSFCIQDSFQKKNWADFNQQEEIFLSDIQKEKTLYIVDTWNLIEKFKGQKISNYILANYDYQISFAENKVYKRKSMTK
jgi:hypothetical protein